MIFSVKIWRLDFFVTFFIKEKSKDYLQIKNSNSNNYPQLALIFLTKKITVRISALAAGSDPRAECETRAAGVAIRKFAR
jgi:hypothetical protein